MCVPFARIETEPASSQTRNITSSILGRVMVQVYSNKYALKTSEQMY